MPDRKKIFDIVPSIKKSRESHKESHKEPFRESPFFSAKKLIPLFVGIVLLAGGVLSYFFIPPKVKIEIWPEQRITNGTVTAIVNTLQGSDNAITGEIAEAEKTLSQNFPATGAKLKLVKASGIIRVYNNYSTAPQILAATTRFVSDDGKLFRTPSRVVVPGGYYEGNKLVPGSIDIKVVADQPGEDYNIDPSTFSIPGFAGTPKYTAFYAKSFEPMKDGLKKEVPQVTQEDLAKAKEILTAKAVAEAKTALKNSVSPGGYIIFDEAIANKLLDFRSAAEVGQEAESFTAQIEAVVSALVFKESGLKNFAENYIREKIPPEEKLLDSLFKVEYLLELNDLAKPELSLKLGISARSYSAPSEIQIKEMIKNKSAKEVEDIIKNLPQIEKARVEFWPFWANLAPANQKDINVVLRLD